MQQDTRKVNTPVGVHKITMPIVKMMSLNRCQQCVDLKGHTRGWRNRNPEPWVEGGGVRLEAEKKVWTCVLRRRRAAI
jgi:hypothetical protein